MDSKIQLFEGLKVRYTWDVEMEEWLFSAVDVCYVLAESASKDPGAYWRKLKQRLKAEGSEVVTNCHGLKMIASDGKMRLTDCFTPCVGHRSKNYGDFSFLWIFRGRGKNACRRGYDQEGYLSEKLAVAELGISGDNA